MNPNPEFPADFLWGAATAAYQVEGSPLADGAGPSIWHRFSHTPGRVANGDTGDVACDHYNRYQADVKVMKQLGLTAYRFSISWSRVLPDGTGQINDDGLDFYRRLVDELLESGIKPMATLYHWDLPAALDDRGGWLNRDIADWFADYARIMFEALDEGVAMWATLNEPWVVSDGGYLHGVLAPGHESLFEPPLATHNLLRSHAAAVAAYRTMGKNQIGIVVNLEPKYAATQNRQDLEATARADVYMNRQVLDPLFFGEYPPELAQMFGQAWPQFPEEDFALLRQPVDFIGINYYKRGVMANDPDVLLERAKRIAPPRSTYTSTDWEVWPEALTDILLWVTERYGKIPLYITENGAAFYDPPTAINGRVEDPLRLDYLRTHLLAARQAIAQGVDLRGYFVWSLLDNFEWAHGYSKRFGIVHVDYATQARTIKDSGKFYAEVIRSRGKVLGPVGSRQ